MLGAVAMARWLDEPSLAPRTRMLVAVVVVAALVGLSWGLGLWANGAYGLDGAARAVRIDLLRAPREWAPPFLIYVLWGGMDAFVQIFAFWVIGQLDDSPAEAGRFTGIYKSLQAAGAAASWAFSTYSWGCGGACAGEVPPSRQAWVNVWLGLASLPGVVWLGTTLRAEDDEMDDAAPAEGGRGRASRRPRAGGERSTADDASQAREAEPAPAVELTVRRV